MVIASNMTQTVEAAPVEPLDSQTTIRAIANLEEQVRRLEKAVYETRET